MASWEEVVKLLERDGKSTEAGKVKEILAKNKGIEAQGRALKQLDWYPTVIVPYLDELRVVNYNCLYEIYREPNDEEVMAQYREKGLKGSYTRYEYWKLFQLITDEKELEALYRRAYEESLEQKHPWALAGNNLAASYLERDTVDTSILEPLIDLSIHSTDYSRMNADGSRTEIVNRLEVRLRARQRIGEDSAGGQQIRPAESLYMGFGRLLPGRNDSGRERTCTQDF